MTNWIWVTTQFEGFHKYPAAPDEVAFLRDRHRHIFKVKVWVEVEHNERDVEFILFKRDVESIISYGVTFELDNKSCESIADYIQARLFMKYARKMRIEISEDGENGCEKEYD